MLLYQVVYYLYMIIEYLYMIHIIHIVVYFSYLPGASLQKFQTLKTPPLAVSVKPAHSSGGRWHENFLLFFACFFDDPKSGSTIRTLLHGKINPKDWQVLSLGDGLGFSYFLGLFQVIMANPVNSLVNFWEDAVRTFWKMLFVSVWLPDSFCESNNNNNNISKNQKPKIRNKNKSMNIVPTTGLSPLRPHGPMYIDRRPGPLRIERKLLRSGSCSLDVQLDGWKLKPSFLSFAWLGDAWTS